jgi:hypothetical protein
MAAFAAGSMRRRGMRLYRLKRTQHLPVSINKAFGSETEMTDIVHYAMDYRVLGNLVHRFIVSPRLENIFD